MPYEHGIRIKENPTSITAPVLNEGGVPVVFGTAPVNMLANPAAAVNKPILAKSFAEAKDALGYSSDYDSFTLCEAMDAFFKVYGVGPVVLVNVLDPETHKAALTEQVTITNKKGTFTAKNVILNGLVLKNGNTNLVTETDYTLAFDEDGTLKVTILSDSTITTVSATGYKLDLTGLSASNIIGSYNAATGAETGFEVLRQVYPKLGVVPGLLLAPGWSDNATVGQALIAKCTEINGAFSCECVLDLDCKTTTVYTGVEQSKQTAGYVSERAICVWPMAKALGGRVFHMSTLYAALCVYTDITNGNVPSLSPSNKELKISATVLGTAGNPEISLDTVQANALNSIGVVTAINVNGFKAWGNNTACFPGNTDPKDRWISCRRFFSWWGNSFIQTYFNKVDDPANFRLIESIVDSENVRGNALVSQGKCAGIKMIYSREDNPIAGVMNGRIVFRQHLAPYTPAEDIVNTLEFDVSMIEAELGGE